MKISICGSITASKKLIEIAEILEAKDIDVELPYSTKMIREGKITLKDYCEVKAKQGDGCFRERANEDFIKKYFKEISKSDAILVVNEEKNGVKGYIGGNALMEIAFAYVLDKRIYLLNEIPDISYKDEIIAMNPEVIHGDLSCIVEK